MKIAFLSTFYPFRGGIAQFNALIYRELEKKNETKAFTFIRQYPNFLFPGKTQFVDENDPAYKISAERVLDTINPFTYISSRKKISKWEPDLILTKYWMTFFGPSLGFVLGGLKNTIRISILDNVIPHEKRFFDASFNRYFLKRNDGFVVMSDKVLSDLLSIVPNAKFIRVNHPVYDHFGIKLKQEDAKSQLKLDNSKKTILFFGIIRDYKGLDLLIEAMSILDDSYQLVIAGEVYGSFEKYQNQIDKLKIASKIKLHTQYIGDDQVNLYFSACDVCVLPYKSATQSGITSISNHFLTPLIATDVGGLKETIFDNETGLIVKEPKAELIAEKINLYFEKDLKNQFSQNIDKYNKENSWENFADKILNFTNELKQNKAKK